MRPPQHPNGPMVQFRPRLGDPYRMRLSAGGWVRESLHHSEDAPLVWPNEGIATEWSDFAFLGCDYSAFLEQGFWCVRAE